MKSGFHLVGDQGLLVRCQDNAQALALKEALAADPVPGILEGVPGQDSLLVRYDSLHLVPEELAEKIAGLMRKLDKRQAPPGQAVTLPVCYDERLGPDLGTLARKLGGSLADAARLHASAAYRVMFMGFLPGFGYLSGLPQALHLPRRAEPRARVPKGSVAVAMEMSAVYPLESPGGWHLIGRTPLKLFDPKASEPFLLQPGGLVRFEAVSLADYLAMGGEAP